MTDMSLYANLGNLPAGKAPTTVFDWNELFTALSAADNKVADDEQRKFYKALNGYKFLTINTYGDKDNDNDTVQVKANTTDKELEKELVGTVATDLYKLCTSYATAIHTTQLATTVKVDRRFSAGLAAAGALDGSSLASKPTTTQPPQPKKGIYNANAGGNVNADAFNAAASALNDF